MPLITWTGLTAGAALKPDGSLQKTTATTSYDTGGQSVERVDSSVGGYVEWTADRTSRYIAGLTPDSTSTSYNDITYGWFNYTTNYVQVYENGNAVGSTFPMATGDILRIEIRNGKVRYFQNGQLRYTSLVAPRGTYEFDVAMYLQNGYISPVNMDTLTWDATKAINFQDWNRIESTMSSLATYLNSIQYPMPSMSTTVNRTVTSIEYLSSINRIEANLDAMYQAFMPLTGYLARRTWNIGDTLSYNDINRLEGNMQLMEYIGQLVTQSYRYCGSTISGGGDF